MRFISIVQEHLFVQPKPENIFHFDASARLLSVSYSILTKRIRRSQYQLDGGQTGGGG